MLLIRGLTARVEGKTVLDAVGIELGAGQVTVIMGANGGGKSSLANVLMGNPDYQIVSGPCLPVGRSADQQTSEPVMLFDGKDLLQMSVDERARAGVFVAWQSPISIPGLSVFAYLRAVYEASGQRIESMVGFRKKIEELLALVGLKEEVVKRNLNEGFSGGEKKRFELLQVLLLQPKVVVLDEVDSGLDVDGLRLVADVVDEIRKNGGSILLITHYARMLEYVAVDEVVVIEGGKVVVKGGEDIIRRIESHGYKNLGK